MASGSNCNYEFAVKLGLLIRLQDKLREEKMQPVLRYLDEYTPFGKITDIKVDGASIKKNIVGPLIKAWDQKTKAFICGGTSYFLDKEFIQKILKLEETGFMPIEEKAYPKDGQMQEIMNAARDVAKSAFDKFIGYTLLGGDEIKASVRHISQIVLVFFFAGFLFPVRNNAIAKYYHVIDHIEDLKDYNFFDCVISFLTKSIEECNEKGTTLVLGCAYLLQVMHYTMLEAPAKCREVFSVDISESEMRELVKLAELKYIYETKMDKDMVMKRYRA